MEKNYPQKYLMLGFDGKRDLGSREYVPEIKTATRKSKMNHLTVTSTSGNH